MSIGLPPPSPIRKPASASRPAAIARSTAANDASSTRTVAGSSNCARTRSPAIRSGVGLVTTSGGPSR
jgi:hypothetical protein